MGGTGYRGQGLGGQGLGGTGLGGEKGSSYPMRHSHTFRVYGGGQGTGDRG